MKILSCKYSFPQHKSSLERINFHIATLISGIIKGDEIMVINGAIVSDLDMMYLESVLQEEVGLCMMMRSSRTEPPDLTGIMRVTDDIIESLVCPPPPTDPPVISEEMISGLIVPAPGWSESFRSILQEIVALRAIFITAITEDYTTSKDEPIKLMRHVNHKSKLR